MKNTIILKYLLLLVVSYIFLSAKTAAFLSNFEDQNTTADIGKEHIELYDGDTMYVVPNPHSDAINSSKYVLKLSTNEGTRSRAEYDAWRNKTIEKTYIYTWKRYHPKGMFTDIKMSWGALNQWKTWPCEVYGTNRYEIFNSSISYPDGGGIFNETRLNSTSECFYVSRAEPCRKVDYYTIPEGYWNQFVLEIYWSNTENGYYRFWKNDTLIGYSDHMKTLFDNFIEDTCDMYWSTGLYVSWAKTNGKTQDSLIAYIDDIAIYDIDSGYTVKNLFPNTEDAPVVQTADSCVYKINAYGLFSDDGYNNYILHYNRDPHMNNLSNTYGQSSNINILIPDLTGNEGTSLSDDCFPSSVINTYLCWYDTVTHPIKLTGLNPNNSYTIRVLSAGSIANQGLQIWTKEENRDTVFSYENRCNMAILNNLVSDNSGNLTINIRATNTSYPRPFLNSIEIVEYKVNNLNTINHTESNGGMRIFSHFVNDNLIVNAEKVPSSITIYSSNGKKVTSATNTNVINLSRLNKGIYIGVIGMKKTFETIRIIRK